MQAVTRVNVEQASKRVMRKPTRLEHGEGWHRWGRERNGTHRLRRGTDDGMHERGRQWQHGKPCGVAVRAANWCFVRSGTGHHRVAEGPVVPMKLGNASGGKGPWFKTDAGSDEEAEKWETYQLQFCFRTRRTRRMPKRRQVRGCGTGEGAPPTEYPAGGSVDMLLLTYGLPCAKA
jgi:hypothetical protein